MPNYIAEATVIIYEQIEVKAKNKKEAKEKARREIIELTEGGEIQGDIEVWKDNTK